MIDVDTIMGCRPCTAWPRDRVASVVTGAMSLVDVMECSAIPTPDRGWVWAHLSGTDIAPLAARIASTAMRRCPPHRAAQADAALARWHADQIPLCRDRGEVAHHFRAVLRDAAYVAAWAVADGGDEWDLAREAEHSRQIKILLETL